MAIWRLPFCRMLDGECHFGDMPKSRHAKMANGQKVEMQNGDMEKRRQAKMANAE